MIQTALWLKELTEVLSYNYLLWQKKLFLLFCFQILQKLAQLAFIVSGLLVTLIFTFSLATVWQCSWAGSAQQLWRSHRNSQMLLFGVCLRSLAQITASVLRKPGWGFWDEPGLMTVNPWNGVLSWPLYAWPAAVITCHTWSTINLTPYPAHLAHSPQTHSYRTHHISSGLTFTTRPVSDIVERKWKRAGQ